MNVIIRQAELPNGAVPWLFLTTPLGDPLSFESAEIARAFVAASYPDYMEGVHYMVVEVRDTNFVSAEVRNEQHC